MLLIWGEDLEDGGDADGKKGRLIVAFSNPSDKGVEMWPRDEDGQDSGVGYVWRSSAVQMQPNVAIWNRGGMNVEVVDRALELRNREIAVEQSTSVKIDIRNRLVEIKGSESRLRNLSDRTKAVEEAEEFQFHAVEDEYPTAISQDPAIIRMRLTGLQCYRMPGNVSVVTRYPSQYLASLRP